jgi:uroporphyrinogen III methyltransferase / synthase
VDVVPLYETVPEPLDDEARAAAAAADYLVFTSASTVRFFAAAAGAEPLRGPRLVTIGPATSAALREHGAAPDIEAEPHTPDGIVEALLRDAATS